MKKTIFSTFLFILFILFLATFYLSFFGFETDKFNKIIKSKINESNNNVTLDFKKISILLDIKKLTLFVKFLNPNLNYDQTVIPLKSLRTNVDLDFLNQKIIFKVQILFFKKSANNPFHNFIF